MNFIDELKFDEKGLIPVIAQDYENGQVLMLAYANREAVALTLEKGTVHYYSRSRQELWHKGDTSGHFQIVKEIFYDCDGDTLLIKVEQKGAACHTGKRSCFYRNSLGEEVL
ncbi:MAG: phosphoribosyl-AMP cyclohydrolase [Anaerotignaceae bacterium]